MTHHEYDLSILSLFIELIILNIIITVMFDLNNTSSHVTN